MQKKALLTIIAASTLALNAATVNVDSFTDQQNGNSVLGLPSGNQRTLFITSSSLGPQL